jgi:hypothetical protein
MTDLIRYSLFNQKIQIDPRSKQPDLRKIPGETLLDFFIPNEPLYLAQNDNYTTAAEIVNCAPPGTQLVLVDRDDLIYASADAAAKLKQVLPIDYLAGAYSSIFKGGCEPIVAERPLKIAVVDYANGYESGDANIPIQVSRQIVHDSYGAIDKNLLKTLTDVDRAIQFRMGVKTADLQTFAKGFLNTIDLAQLFPAGDAPDAILSLDSFKGVKPAPGLYEFAPNELFLGIKGETQNTSSAISELLSLFPQTAEDVLPVIQAEAQLLAAHSQNLVLAAAWALNDYYLSNDAQTDEFNTIATIDMALASGKYGLLDSLQVKDWLGDRLGAAWRNLSFADTHSLNGVNATVFPAWDLKYGEIAVPWLKDGEEFVFFRSPVVNETGVVTVRNNLEAWQYLQKLGADPKAMYVNIQTLDRIEAEDPATYNLLIEEYGSEDRLKAEFQTLLESLQMDFDGDTGNAISRSVVPSLFDAVSIAEHPDNKIPSFTKRAKNLPTEMTLPEVATHIRPPYVNLVYAQKARLHLSKSEIDLAIEYGDSKVIDDLANEYSDIANKLLFKVSTDKFVGCGIDGVFHQVTLPSQMKDAARIFSDSFGELAAIERNGSAGYHRILFKIIDFQKSLANFRDDYESLEFVTPDGKVKQKLSAKLSAGISEFNKVYLPNLIKKYPERASDLQEIVDSYQKLSRSIEKEIDINIPLKFGIINERFNRDTKSHENYIETRSSKLLRLAAGPELTNVDRLRFYQVLLDEAISVTSQLNQDAVDVFKSANDIPVELSSAISINLSRDKYDSVAGKSNSSIYNNNYKPKPLGFSLPELLQDLCNQNYQPLDLEGSSINTNLVSAFKNIKISSTALAIANFYINDDRDAVDKFAEYNRIRKLAGRERTYLQIAYSGDRINIFNVDREGFSALKNAEYGTLKLSLLDGNVVYQEEDGDGNPLAERFVGSLDLDWAKKFAASIDEDLLEFDARDFREGVKRGVIDFRKVGDTKTQIQRERKVAVVSMRAAFEGAEIEPLESLAAIAKVTGNANPGLLLAAYPKILADRVKSMSEDLLVLDPNIAADLQTTFDNHTFEFYVDAKGTLNISDSTNNRRVEFASNIHRQAYKMSGNFADKAKASKYSTLPVGLMGEGKIITEAANLSIQLSNNKRVLAVNLADSIQVPDTQNLTLEAVKSSPYTIDIKGIQCPIVSLSAEVSKALTESIGEAGSTTLKFKEFRATPRSLQTQLPMFAGVLELDGKDYYLSGSMPDRDRAGEPIDYSQLLPDYVAFKNIARQISKAEPVTMGYELCQNIDGERQKVGEITFNSAMAAALTGQEQILAVSPNMRYRLDIPRPDRITNTAVWQVEAKPQVYQPIVYGGKQQDAGEKLENNAQMRAQLLGELSNNRTLMTEIVLPTIQNAGVEFRNFYQIDVPVSRSQQVQSLLGRQKIPYKSSLDTDPKYLEEYQRGYEVLLIDALDLERKKGSKVNKLERLTSEFGEPLDRQAYDREIAVARVVRPAIGTDLRKLGDWLAHSDFAQIELPQIDIDRLGKVPRFLKGIQAEAKSRFGARMGTSEDGKHAVFSFGVDYLRQQFDRGLSDTPINIEYLSAERQRPVYAAVVPIVELESFMREHYHQCSYNFDPASSSTINPVLKTFNVKQLSKLPARATIDIAMGFNANKFIGKSLAEATTRTDLYVEAFGESANTKTYTADDIVMLTGNRFVNKQIGREVMGKFFQSEYLPLLKSARKAGATILIGNGNSIDALAKQYLTDSGYAILEHPSGYSEAVPANRSIERQRQLNELVNSKLTTVLAEPTKTSKRSVKEKSSEISEAVSIEDTTAETIDRSTLNSIETESATQVSNSQVSEPTTKRKYLRSLLEDADLSRIQFETEILEHEVSLSI